MSEVSSCSHIFAVRPSYQPDFLDVLQRRQSALDAFGIDEFVYVIFQLTYIDIRLVFRDIGPDIGICRRGVDWRRRIRRRICGRTRRRIRGHTRRRICERIRRRTRRRIRRNRCPCATRYVCGCWRVTRLVLLARAHQHHLDMTAHERSRRGGRRYRRRSGCSARSRRCGSAGNRRREGRSQGGGCAGRRRGSAGGYGRGHGRVRARGQWRNRSGCAGWRILRRGSNDDYDGLGCWVGGGKKAANVIDGNARSRGDDDHPCNCNYQQCEECENAAAAAGIRRRTAGIRRRTTGSCRCAPASVSDGAAGHG